MENKDDPSDFDEIVQASTEKNGENVIENHNFSHGLSLWHANSCDAVIVSSNMSHGYAKLTNRKQCWQGLELDITAKLSAASTYNFIASVGVSGYSVVLATLKLESHGNETKYQQIGRIELSEGEWKTVEGTFTVSTIPDRVVFYLEGPDPGVDLLIKSVFISSSTSTRTKTYMGLGDGDIILNPTFSDGLKHWSGRGCKLVLRDFVADAEVVPHSGKVFAAATQRSYIWNGIQQDITGRVKRKLAYEAIASVRIYGKNVNTATVSATLWVQTHDERDQYIGISKVEATDTDWSLLQGKFLISCFPSRVVIFLEGPAAGTDIILNSFVVKRAPKILQSPRPISQDAEFGVNIIQNSDLSDGTSGWFPLGNCTLKVCSGSPRIVPPMVRDSLGPHEPLSGRYILATKRTQTWMGPAQIITDKVKLFLTYQVSAWVRIGSTACWPQSVNVALAVDGKWVNGGQVEISDHRWHVVSGSFRIEKKPSKVMVHIQGPDSGVDLMVGSLQIFAVDHQARFKSLRDQTDKLRKQDVVLKFTGTSSLGSFVKVRQTKNSFPFGSSLNRLKIDNEDVVDFFLKNFNWAVFENELKWYWTEAKQGEFNYSDSDYLLDFCQKNNIETRGHCIFWDVNDAIHSWIKALNKDDLTKAVQNRLTGLLTRYKGKFRHYDVNNEMLHGSFYPDKLGEDIRAYMFKTANTLDPSALLFVNDYHIEDGNDHRSCPEKYIEHILELQKQGAPVGGIGIQGHINSPVGSIVCSALNKLGVLGLPIWFTELDVSSINDHIRADDLEVMLREAFAHPAVEGIMLWGFWELFMSRTKSHLVNAEGDINEAGKRYIKLKQEWTTNTHGPIDDQGQFKFRGFCGSYEVEIVSLDNRFTRTFMVDKGDSPLVVPIDL